MQLAHGLKASGARLDRRGLLKLLKALVPGEMLMVTRRDRSTRDLLNTLAAITGRKAGFRFLGNAWLCPCYRPPSTSGEANEFFTLKRLLDNSFDHMIPISYG